VMFVTFWSVIFKVKTKGPFDSGFPRWRRRAGPSLAQDDSDLYGTQ
jgi:hypothetical protein